MALNLVKFPLLIMQTLFLVLLLHQHFSNILGTNKVDFLNFDQHNHLHTSSLLDLGQQDNDYSPALDSYGQPNQLNNLPDNENHHETNFQEHHNQLSKTEQDLSDLEQTIKKQQRKKTFYNSSVDSGDSNEEEALINQQQQQQQQLQQQQQQQQIKTFLTRELIRETCDLDRGSQRNEHINNSYLIQCSRYKLENLLSNELLMSIMHHDSGDCSKILDEFVQLDEVIGQFDLLFKNLLTRYNCQNGYSVKWSCDDCKRAYTDWICATHLPYYMNGERIKPCISFCERVEQRCPYLHPITREQYGGQPVFICRDPNIPFVPEITPEIPYNDPGKCYDLCHLSDNLTELITDSLSKYDYDRCPDKNSIAEEVCNDPYHSGSTHCTNLKTASMQHRGASDSSEKFTGQMDPTSLAEDDSSSGKMEKYYEIPVIIANRKIQKKPTKVLFTNTESKMIQTHRKKLDELREVLANYKNQAKTHRYHADHSSLYHQSTLS